MKVGCLRVRWVGIEWELFSRTEILKLSRHENTSPARFDNFSFVGDGPR